MTVISTADINMKTIAMRPVIRNDYKCRFIIAMEIKIFDGCKSKAHHLYEGWEKYLFIYGDTDIARLAGMTREEYKTIGLKAGYKEEHGLLVFDGRKQANELLCKLWSRQLHPMMMQFEITHKNVHHVNQYKLIETIAEYRKPFDK